MKMRDLEIFEGIGIQSTYRVGHLSGNASKSIKRKFVSHHTQLGRQDLKIESQNKKVYAAHDDALVANRKKVQDLSASALDSPGPSSNALMKATTALEKSTVAFERVVDGAISLVGTGSGKVPLLLPPTHVDFQSTHRK